MLLGLAASVSDFSMDTVQKAIGTVSTKNVWQWVKDKVGKSVYSKRKAIYEIIKKWNKTRMNINALIRPNFHHPSYRLFKVILYH
jgi:hypothetical protein